MNRDAICISGPAPMSCDWCDDDDERTYSLIDPVTGDWLTLCVECAREHARAVLHRQPTIEDRAQSTARWVLRMIAREDLSRRRPDLFPQWTIKVGRLHPFD